MLYIYTTSAALIVLSYQDTQKVTYTPLKKHTRVYRPPSSLPKLSVGIVPFADEKTSLAQNLIVVNVSHSFFTNVVYLLFTGIICIYPMHHTKLVCV